MRAKGKLFATEDIGFAATKSTRIEVESAEVCVCVRMRACAYVRVYVCVCVCVSDTFRQTRSNDVR